jgi:hypothetical protein
MTNEAIQKAAQPAKIAVVGAGGIGSMLVPLLVRSLQGGGLVRKLGGVRITLFDSDCVEGRNTLFQNFVQGDIGKKKVNSLKGALAGFENDFLEIVAITEDVRSPGDLGDQDLVVVCVDSSQARSTIHASKFIKWADLRCSGDGYIALDHSVDAATLTHLTGHQEPASCQLEGAIESGNLQMGFVAVAAWGAQWAIQSLRGMAGEENAKTPRPGSSSITFGTLGFLPLAGGRHDG